MAHQLVHPKRLTWFKCQSKNPKFYFKNDNGFKEKKKKNKHMKEIREINSEHRFKKWLGQKHGWEI